MILRHAKSDWGDATLLDRDRPLNKRGVAAARLLGTFLARSGRAPELVLSSPAVRARTTVELAAEAGDWSCPVQLVDSLYESSPEETLRVVHGADDSVESLMLVGHEPVWSSLVVALMGGGRVRFPTAALACLQFDAERWSGVRSGRGTLVWQVVPKLLQGALDS